MPREAESISAEPGSRTWGPACLPGCRGRGCWAFGKQKGIPQRGLARAVCSGRQACLMLFSSTRGRCQIHGCNPAHVSGLEDSRPHPIPSWRWVGWGFPVHTRAAEAVVCKEGINPRHCPMAPTPAPQRGSRYQGSYEGLTPSLVSSTILLKSPIKFKTTTTKDQNSSIIPLCRDKHW